LTDYKSSLFESFSLAFGFVSFIGIAFFMGRVFGGSFLNFVISFFIGLIIFLTFYFYSNVLGALEEISIELKKNGDRLKKIEKHLTSNEDSVKD